MILKKDMRFKKQAKKIKHKQFVFYIFIISMFFFNICSGQQKDTVFKKEYSGNVNKVKSELVGRYEVDKNGNYKCYNNKEQIIVEGNYQKYFLFGYFVTHFKRINLQEGSWIYYNEKGEIIKEEKYKKGKLLFIEEFIK